ncbi:hypothetical protein PoB_002625200 [Plakobranchus ocellatus]|uniref:Uncharacterized protein n=1 Tax=Plakobranchus ocellatus TaxID=259542 RepID=A0AAV3ZYH8_9GAST|nr:hypothetical protein PoB_002625200 [Plakobranchus ocellatus]
MFPVQKRPNILKADVLSTGQEAVSENSIESKRKIVFRATTVSRIIRGHLMTPPFPLPNRAADVRPGCKTQRIAPTLRQVADLVCARTKETK